MRKCYLKELKISLSFPHQDIGELSSSMITFNWDLYHLFAFQKNTSVGITGYIRNLYHVMAPLEKGVLPQ